MDGPPSQAITRSARHHEIHFLPTCNKLNLKTMTISNNVSDHVKEVDVLIAGGTSEFPIARHRYTLNLIVLTHIQVEPLLVSSLGALLALIPHYPSYSSRLAKIITMTLPSPLQPSSFSTSRQTQKPRFFTKATRATC